MNRVKHTEWIDAYIEDELDAAGKYEFETALKTNSELALEFQMEQDLNKILHEEDLLDFRSKCIQAQNEQKVATRKSVKVIQFTRKYWYGLASALFIGIIAGTILLLNPGDYSGEKLFKMYYKSGETIGISRTGSVSVAEALLYFGKNDFQNADELFDQILLNEPRNFAVMYYSGISNIELKNFQKSIRMFENILQDKDNLYTEFAEWYLGLSYLALEESHQAASLFESITGSPDHLHAKEASSILDKMEKSGKSKKILNNLFFLILPF